MKNKVPYHIAKAMYDLQEYCSKGDIDCFKCVLGGAECSFADGYRPYEWGITQADLERLEREHVQ